MKQFKKTRRMFAMAMALIMTFGLVIAIPSTALANDPTLELAVVTPATEISEGADVTLEVRISNNPGFSMVEYSLVFDSAAIENFTRTGGAPLGGFGFTGADATGVSTGVVDDSIPGNTDDGVLSIYTFTVADDTPEDTVINVTLVLGNTTNAAGVPFVMSLGTASVDMTVVEGETPPTALVRVAGPATLVTGRSAAFEVALYPADAVLGTYTVNWSRADAIASVAPATGLTTTATAGTATGAGEVIATLTAEDGTVVYTYTFNVTVGTQQPAEVTIGLLPAFGSNIVAVTIRNTTGADIEDGYLVVSTAAVVDGDGTASTWFVVEDITVPYNETIVVRTNIIVDVAGHTQVSTWLMEELPNLTGATLIGRIGYDDWDSAAN